MSSKPVKMKAADPQQVNIAMLRAIHDWPFADEAMRENAGDLVYRIHRALANMGVALIVPDMPDPEGVPLRPKVTVKPRCYCDSADPRYVQPSNMSQYRNCPAHPVRG